MNDSKKLHDTLDLLGLRAQATAAGMIQLAVELARVGAIDQAALGRIKNAIHGEICLRRPTSVPKNEYDQTMRRRLDALFSGEETIGVEPPAEVAAVIEGD